MSPNSFYLNVFLCYSPVGNASASERKLQSVVFPSIVLSGHHDIGYSLPGNF